MSETNSKDNFEDLKWVRAFSPDIIPRYLIEQIKQRDYDINDFYKYHSLNCLVDNNDGNKLNPFNHLYVLINEEKIVKGFLWFIIDPLTKDIIINNYSIDNEYWNKGKAVKKLVDFMKKMLDKLNLTNIYWITKYPKQSQRYGFKPSKSVLMEYKEEKNGESTDGRHQE